MILSLMRTLYFILLSPNVTLTLCTTTGTLLINKYNLGYQLIVIQQDLSSIDSFTSYVECDLKVYNWKLWSAVFRAFYSSYKQGVDLTR